MGPAGCQPAIQPTSSRRYTRSRFLPGLKPGFKSGVEVKAGSRTVGSVSQMDSDKAIGWITWIGRGKGESVVLRIPRKAPGN